MSPLLIGQDARDISRLWDVMYNGTRAHFAIDRGHVFPILGRSGGSVAAIGGIDMALWTILGKSLKAQVQRMLGGRRRETMQAYPLGGWARDIGPGTALTCFSAREHSPAQPEKHRVRKKYECV